MDAALDTILPAGAKLEMLPAEGFEGGEGPVWVQDGKAGYLLFPGSRIYKWVVDCFSYPCPPAGKMSVFLEHAGTKDSSYTGSAGAGGARDNAVTNGLTQDRQTGFKWFPSLIGERSSALFSNANHRCTFTAWRRSIDRNAPRHRGTAPARWLEDYSGFRWSILWRRHSNKTTPAATDTLSDEIGPAIGIRTVTSQCFFTS